jgi:hypothetical protein
MQTILNLCIADKELSKEELRNKYDACAQDWTGAPNDVIVKI